MKKMNKAIIQIGKKTSIDTILDKTKKKKYDKYDLPWFNRPQITMPDNLSWIIYILVMDHFYA